MTVLNKRPHQWPNSSIKDVSFISILACVASVSVGLSAGLKHFSLFERAKLGASTKKCEKGVGKGGKETLARKPHDF